MYKVKKFVSTGVLHLQKNIPCQDYCDYFQDDAIAIGLLSDGAGSALFAKEAAELVVNHGINYLKVASKTNLFNTRYCNNNLKSYAKECLLSCEFQLKKLAKKQKEHLNNYNCTVLGFFTYKDRTVLFQIGDGAIVYRRNMHHYKLTFNKSKYEFHNETDFVISSSINKLQIKVLENIDFIFLTSDGLENICIHDNEPYHLFFSHLEGNIHKENFNEEYQKFLDFDVQVNSLVDDDKSSVILSKISNIN